MSEYNFTILLDSSQIMTHTHTHTHTVQCNYHNCVQRSRKHRVRPRLHTLTCANKDSFPSSAVLRRLQNRPDHFPLTMRLEPIYKTNLMKRDRKLTEVIFLLLELKEDALDGDWLFIISVKTQRVYES